MMMLDCISMPMGSFHHALVSKTFFAVTIFHPITMTCSQASWTGINVTRALKSNALKSIMAFPLSLAYSVAGPLTFMFFDHFKSP